MGLFTSFNAGVAGINSAQLGLNTTGHNVANTKTPGYTRQQNIQTDMYYQTYKTTEKSTMKIGYGSTIAEVRQIRDQFLDREYRTEAGRLEFYDTLFTTENEIEDIFGEMEGVEFQESLHNLWNTIQDINDNPELITQREVFIANAQAFLEKANNVYQAMRDYQINLNTEIESQVLEINKIADQIAQLNLNIATAEASGLENANDYRDERNLLMDKLAKYTYYEYQEDLNHMVTIRINNGPLVDNTTVHHLKCQNMEVTEYDPDTKEYVATNTMKMYEVVWESGGFGDVYHFDKAYSREDNTDVGSLLGIFTARGNKYGYYTDIPMREDYPSDYAYSKAVDKYNNSTGNCLLVKMEAQFDLLIHKVVTAINDAFAPNVELTSTDRFTSDPDQKIVPKNSVGFADSSDPEEKITGTDAAGKAVEIDLSTNTITVDGTAVTMSSISVLDASRCPVGADENETIGTELFVRRTVKDEARYDVYTLEKPLYLLDADGKIVTDEHGKQIALTQSVPEKDAEGNFILNDDGTPKYTYKLYVYREENPVKVDTLYTLQNLEVDPKILENYSYLPLKGNDAIGNYGTYDFKGVFGTMLSNLRSENTMLDPNARTTYGTDKLYDAMIGGLAVQGSVWKSQLENQESLTNSVEDKRQQIAGVSTDEEMVALLMYQHAYNAASRYITVIDEMLEHLVERLG